MFGSKGFKRNFVFIYMVCFMMSLYCMQYLRVEIFGNTMETIYEVDVEVVEPNQKIKVADLSSTDELVELGDEATPLGAIDVEQPKNNCDTTEDDPIQDHTPDPSKEIMKESTKQYSVSKGVKVIGSSPITLSDLKAQNEVIGKNLRIKIANKTYKVVYEKLTDSYLVYEGFKFIGYLELKDGEKISSINSSNLFSHIDTDYDETP